MVLAFAVSFVVGLTAEAQVQKNYLAPTDDPPCGGKWNPPCGDPPPPAAKYCCRGQVTIFYERKRIVTVDAKQCRRKTGSSQCDLSTPEQVINCTGMEFEFFFGSDTVYGDLVCMNLGS